MHCAYPLSDKATWLEGSNPGHCWNESNTSTKPAASPMSKSQRLCRATSPVTCARPGVLEPIFSILVAPSDSPRIIMLVILDRWSRLLTGQQCPHPAEDPQGWGPWQQHLCLAESEPANIIAKLNAMLDPSPNAAAAGTVKTNPKTLYIHASHAGQRSNYHRNVGTRLCAKTKSRFHEADADAPSRSLTTFADEAKTLRQLLLGLRPRL